MNNLPEDIKKYIFDFTDEGVFKKEFGISIDFFNQYKDIFLNATENYKYILNQENTATRYAFQFSKRDIKKVRIIYLITFYIMLIDQFFIHENPVFIAKRNKFKSDIKVYILGNKIDEKILGKKFFKKFSMRYLKLLKNLN